MPVKIWIIRSVREALPKTYHQPMGPATDRGIGCVSMGPKLSRRHRRASNHSPIARSYGLIRHPSPEYPARLDNEEPAPPAGLAVLARRSGTGRGEAAPR